METAVDEDGVFLQTLAMAKALSKEWLLNKQGASKWKDECRLL